ncbi:sugar phosphate isomerase/epimerase family protein [Vibrio cionasavignyae]|uniref:sugar phosphate isomerase/epimerase family protein n=1 Tax=Vibrio cionasavignyae TaxID=2910252 RepID=UPI003D143331
MYLSAQLFGVHEAVLRRDLNKILKFLSETGFHGVEMPFLLEAATPLQELGLHCSALHIAPERLYRHGEILDYLHRHNCRDLCVSGPIGWHDRSIENYKATCDLLNSASEFYAQEGIKIHYHNHDFEFLLKSGDANWLFSVLERELNVEQIDLCVDVGWLHLAKIDVIGFLKVHGDRASHLHLRDFSKNKSVALGRGDVCLPELFSHLDKLKKLRWLVVEFEPTINFAADFKQSWQHVNSLSEQLIGSA